MKASSLDLRQEIRQAYDHQRGSPRALAAIFGVSHAFLEPWRRRTTGVIAPRPHAGGRQPHCDPAALTLVRPLVHEQPGATLAELWAQLQQRRGPRISVATRGRLLPRLGRPRNERPVRPRNATRRGSSRPAPPPGSAPPSSRSGP
jgi:transposase